MKIVLEIFLFFYRNANALMKSKFTNYQQIVEEMFFSLNTNRNANAK